MQDIVEKIRNFPHIRIIAAIVALGLLVWAWKFGIEGLAE